MAYAKQTNKAQAMKNEHLRHGGKHKYQQDKLCLKHAKVKPQDDSIYQHQRGYLHTPEPAYASHGLDELKHVLHGNAFFYKQA